MEWQYKEYVYATYTCYMHKEFIFMDSKSEQLDLLLYFTVTITAYIILPFVYSELMN